MATKDGRTCERKGRHQENDEGIEINNDEVKEIIE